MINLKSKIIKKKLSEWILFVLNMVTFINIKL
jgi:hypothetical protein